MSQPYYGDLPQDPQDAARDAALSASDAADYYDPGTPLPAPVKPSIHEILNLFCSQDETRHVLQKPFNQNDYTYATDGRIMVRVPQLAEVENNIELNYPDVTAIWNQNASFLRGPLEDLPELPDNAGESTMCVKCDGTGVDTCPCCNSEIDCDDCHEGWIKDPRWIQIGDRRHRLAQLALLKRIGAKFSQIQIPENYLYFTNGEIEGVLSGPHDGAKLSAADEWKGGAP